MNNFVFSQDPLLYTALSSRQNPQSEYDMKRQLDEAVAQYQALSQQQPSQQKPQAKDYLGEIDDMVRSLDEDVMLTLNSDIEYLKINEDLQKYKDEIYKKLKPSLQFEYPYSDTSQIPAKISVSKLYPELLNDITDDESLIIKAENLEEAVKSAYKNTKKDGVCILSPAASSYNEYKNFEEKGRHYKELVKKYGV